MVRRNHTEARIEIGTWGEPIGGWGVPLWTGKPDRAKKAMDYFLARLPQFPPAPLPASTWVSVPMPPRPMEAMAVPMPRGQRRPILS